MSATHTSEIRHINNCVDYQTYVAPLDTTITPPHYAALKKALMSLGVSEPERMGVVYVRGPWGFMVIPGAGFPELRISFYHDTPIDERDAVLVSIVSALHEGHAFS